MERKPNGYWTKEKCHEKSLKYKYKQEFRKDDSKAHNAARRRGWLDDICGHMVELKKQYGYWQKKENCIQEALKYSNRTEFYKNCKRGYQVSRENNWLDDICNHMERRGNRHKKCVYVCVFYDNQIYVGITYNFNERKKEHLKIHGRKISSVGKHIIESGLTPNIIKLTEYLQKEEAILLEEKYVNKYRNENFIILNKIKTGGIGGSEIKWNKENCIKEALKYKTRNNFRVKSAGAYDAAHRYGWLNEITEHMLLYKKYNGYWTKENCGKEALKYKNRTDFSKKSSGAYDTAHRNNWLDDVCKHMINIKKPNGYWTKERCFRESRKYNTRSEFQKKSRSAYMSAMKHKWLNEICAHMSEIRKPKGYWTKKRCEEEFLKYDRKKNVKLYSKTAYSVALKNNWIKELTLHMNFDSRKPNDYWTKERCYNLALKYKKLKDFRLNEHRAYDVAKKHKFLKEIITHLKKIR